MAKKIRPAKETDVTAYLRRLFLKTEQELIREIMRKRSAGYVDYAEAAALERVQKILQDMVDDSWEYIPEMIETIFYHSDKDAAGYANARTLTAAQTDVVQQLSNNLLGEIMEMAGTARKSVEAVFTIARLENDPFRRLTLEQVLRQEAAGGFVPDDFSHEHSLVLEGSRGLVLFNSCSHGGIVNIVRGVKEQLGRPVYAVFGGLHLFSAKAASGMNCTPEYALSVADALVSEGVEQIYTGHCTGQAALALLQDRLGERIQALTTGLCVTLE